MRRRLRWPTFSSGLPPAAPESGHPADNERHQRHMAVASRDTIEGEVGRLALLGTLLVVSLLLLIYRSLPLLLLGLLPVATGAVARIACVSLGFGHVHGLTLGFGTTLIGEAVDYSIYYFLQRGDGDQTAFWRTIRLGS